MLFTVAQFWPEDAPHIWIGGTFVLRFGEAVLDALPELVAGLLIAGFLRHFIGDALLRRWLARGTAQDLPAAFITAVALPVGGLGVLPVVWSLNRAGVRLPSLAVILLVGGAVTPLSFAYLLERAGPAMAWLLLAMLALASAAIFLVAQKLGSADDAASQGDDAPGLIASLAEVRTLLGQLAIPLLLAVTLTAAVASILPPSFMGEALLERSLPHAIGAIFVPVAAYYTPETASLFAGEAAASSFPGAAFTALLGAGISGATAILFLKLANLRNAVALLLATLAIAVAGFAALDAVPRLVAEAPEDTHAFDGLSRPFHVLDDTDGVFAGIGKAWQIRARPIPIIAFLLLAIVPWNRFIQREASRTTMHVPARTIGGVLVVYALVWMVGTLYIYYPSPYHVLDQARHVEGYASEAFGQNDRAAASAACDELARLCRRGEVGALLRLDRDSKSAFTEAREEARRVAAYADSTNLTPGQSLEYREISPLFNHLSQLRRSRQ